MKINYSDHLNELGFREAVPKPTEAELNQFYGEKYYQSPQGTYSDHYRPEELRYFKNVAKVADQTVSACGTEKSLLDLGCGEGFFSRYFHELNWQIACSDYSEFGLKKHNSELLPFFRAGDLHDSIGRYSQEVRRFGLVNLQNVLEHVIDPIRLLLEIKKLLGGNSILRVRVPNDYSEFQQALIDKGLTTNTWFSAPEHLSYFNVNSLSATLKHCGYTIRSMQADFPIELFLANPHSNYWKDRSLGKGAHLTRVFCENFLIQKDVRAYIEYSEAAAKLGFGRELIAYASMQ